MKPWVICAIFRNEARYLKEWVEFHLLMGVSKFYLYNHLSDDDWESVLRPYMDQGVVIVINWPCEPPCQLQAYERCIALLKDEDTWAAFIDCDEFLWAPTRPNVTDALNSIPREWGAIGVNWMCFGSSARSNYTPQPVIERFTWRPHERNDFNLHIKSIIRMGQNIRVGVTPHQFEVEHGTYSEHGQKIHGPFTNKHSSRFLRINHYSSKSREEWLERNLLGKPDRPKEMPSDPSWYDARQAMDVDDRDIQKYLPELKKRLYGVEVGV